MKKSRKEHIREIQIQWVFILLGALLAFLGGITVNALYELLRRHSSALFICIFFGVLFLFFLHIFTFLFENFEKLQDDPDESGRHLVSLYLKHNYQKIKSLLKKAK